MENYKPEDTFNGEFSYLLSDEIGHSSNIRIEIRDMNNNLIKEELFDIKSQIKLM